MAEMSIIVTGNHLISVHAGINLKHKFAEK